ncbi:MAG: hypothetical protein LUG54_11200 [Clostridiales bacterium]|nr:hypothetical protein [Clostridiales bacterium]
MSAVSTDSEGNICYTIDGQGSVAATSTNRYVEYTADVTNNLTSLSEETVYSDDLAGVDAIILTTDAVETAIKADEIINTGSTDDPEFISVNKMETLYGISMNSVENALGMGYILARIYDDSASELNAKYVYEYFASKFYHIKSSKLKDIYYTAIVDSFVTDGEDLEEDQVTDPEYDDLHVSDTSYDEEALEDLLLNMQCIIRLNSFETGRLSQ